MIAMAGALYKGINRARRALYRRGTLKGKRLPRPVISIGNIAAGGTGKTPAVIAVCRFLESRGLRAAVLTRGYGREDTSASGKVVALDAARFGDEPVLIKKATNADVIIGANRYHNAVQYLRNNECDVFVLDDGFQHLQLQRDFDLVIEGSIDSSTARHSTFYREGRSALEDADAVIPRNLRTTVAAKGNVFAFSALADNGQFFDSLRAAGLEVTGTRGFRDHHRYTAEDLAALKRDAKGATLVTTAKDAVKIDDPDIVVAEAEFVIDEDVLEQIAAVAASPPERRAKRRKNALLQRIEYILYRAVSGRAVKMSDEKLHRWGTRLGALASKVLRRRDQLAMRNLRMVYPDRDPHELRRMLDEAWRHFGRELLVFLEMRNLSAPEIAERCPTVNAHLLEEAIARGKGTMVISGHWGGWEVASLAIMSLLPNALAVARPLDNELLERDLQQLRARTGAEVVDRRRAARALMKGLSGNGVVMLLADQAVQPREGVLVPFLGRPAWTTPAPAKLALRTGATIVFAFCIPDGLRHRLEFVEPIRADQLGEGERDPVVLTERINEVISRRINSRPDLWLWMHDRWKGTGEGESHGG